MIREFALPDLGEGLTEAEIVQWLVAEGETVTLNQTIAEVETAKAVVELPSPYAGAVARLFAAVGETVAVGAPLVSFALDGAPDGPVGDEDPGAAPADGGDPFGAPADDDVSEHGLPADPVAGEGETVPATLVGYGAAGGDGTRPRRRRRLPAGDDGGSGRTAGEARPAEAASVPASVGETRVPIRGVRKHTAAAMVRSAFTAPHASVFLDVDVTATVELLGSFAHDRALTGSRVGILAVTARCVCLALRRTPMLGARWDDAAQEIVVPEAVNLGIAAATDRGLVVPHVPAADRLDLRQLADAIAELVDLARSGRTAPERLTGGTFTITNIGVFGVDTGIPLLNPGETGILGLGAVRRRPWEHEGEVALRDIVTLSLSFDHRVVDGAEASRFLTDVGGLLREPGRALLF